MTKPFSLQTLLDLMQNRADEATRSLGKLIAAEKDARTRLEMLQQYRQEYADKLYGNAQQGVSQQEWRNFQEFLGRLDEAIDVQTRAVQDSVQRTANGQNFWLEQRNRLKAIDTLSERHQSTERYLANRQEQKQSDEFSARKHLPDSNS
jgi:flagellar FliJ protein